MWKKKIIIRCHAIKFANALDVFLILFSFFFFASFSSCVCVCVSYKNVQSRQFGCVFMSMAFWHENKPHAHIHLFPIRYFGLLGTHRIYMNATATINRVKKNTNEQNSNSWVHEQLCECPWYKNMSIETSSFTIKKSGGIMLGA